MSTQATKSFDTSRKEAAEILKVSTRTLDRYITNKKLSTKSIAGRIFLNSEELTNFSKQTRSHKSIKRSAPRKASRPAKAKQPKRVQEYEDDDVYTIPVEQGDIVSSVEDRVYKKLYEEIRSDVKSFQQRLEGANYRVGQLESELKASVPLLDHQKLLTGHKKERYNKRILYILLGVLLAVQPVWIILSFL
ncbi:hypothetical protein ACFL3C_05265 [Patescibacteria group bacterium]